MSKKQVRDYSSMVNTDAKVEHPRHACENEKQEGTTVDTAADNQPAEEKATQNVVSRCLDSGLTGRKSGFTVSQLEDLSVTGNFKAAPNTNSKVTCVCGQMGLTYAESMHSAEMKCSNYEPRSAKTSASGEELEDVKSREKKRKAQTDVNTALLKRTRTSHSMATMNTEFEFSKIPQLLHKIADAIDAREKRMEASIIALLNVFSKPSDLDQVISGSSSMLPNSQGLKKEVEAIRNRLSTIEHYLEVSGFEDEANSEKDRDGSVPDSPGSPRNPQEYESALGMSDDHDQMPPPNQLSRQRKGIHYRV
ncbi:hypothetical protein CVT25_000037 [Psilocybe cyanescens]|uniref:Uncharacterized protein n=1 Tax=Psilocybe cyanescens TaxID=93625 RepID=A0A409VX21_PSICY|nr:hypothetical protein CVT25_000037 [Psilocybe cyanescens]